MVTASNKMRPVYITNVVEVYAYYRFMYYLYIIVKNFATQ